MAAWNVLWVAFASLLLSVVLSTAQANPAGNVNFDPDFFQSAGWSLETFPGVGDDVTLRVLKRTPLAPPVRYLVVVVPGSGCTGWLPVAKRYFAGLLHAELLVLHKPRVDVSSGLNAVCSAEFVQNDTLSGWRDQARLALRTYFANLPDSKLPVLLVGISEGAEVLPDLAPEVPHLAGVVMIAAPGLDPLETGQLQARRLGQESAWLALARMQGSDASDNTIYQGRTLRYWRDFWGWELAQPLLDAPWPLLRIWGGEDTQVPELAYQRFSLKAQSRSASICQIRLPDADHGLQADHYDGLQLLWARLEAWGRSPASDLCEMVLP